MPEMHIEKLDLRDFNAGTEASRQVFVDTLKRALNDTGFFYLARHGISQELIERSFETYPRFFSDLPPDVRLKYEYPEVGRQYGYTPIGVETGEHAAVPDLKHFFHVLEDNIIEVPEVPGFTDVNRALFAEFQRVYHTLLSAVALSLDLPETYFEEKTGDSLLRVLHYPAHDNPTAEDERVEEVTEGGNVVGMCASRHTDINMLTLLLARQAGLQLLYHGEWVPMLISDPNVLIVNCGDMLQHLTGGRYKSGEHRVVCAPGKERYSMPFFGHVKGEVSLVPLEHLGDSDLERFHFETAGEFLHARLVQIGLLEA